MKEDSPEPGDRAEGKKTRSASAVRERVERLIVE